MDERTRFNTDSLRNGGLLAVVAIAHLAVLSSIGNMRAAAVFSPPSLPPLIVELVRPAPPPPQRRLPPLPPGGAPTAASRIHTPPQPPLDVVPELIAPIVQAPAPQPIVGLSDKASLIVGVGGDGEGVGAGSGDGAGASPAASVVRPARWLRRATTAEVLEAYPAAALRANRSGRATLRCDILLNKRLTGCRVLAVSPAGEGFNTAALTVSRHFRFEPATLDGRPLDREEIIIEVRFDPLPARRGAGT